MRIREIEAFIVLLAGMLFGPTAWSQEEVAGMPGLAAWLRADRAEVTADRKVTAWPDSAGKIGNLVATGDAPTLVERAVNGRPAVRFTGSEGSLGIANFDWSEHGFTVFVVAVSAEGPAKAEYHPNHRNVTTPGKALVSDGSRMGVGLGLNWNGRPGGAGGIPDQAPIYEDFEPPYENPAASDLLVVPKTPYVLTYASTDGKRNAAATQQNTKLNLRVWVNGVAASDELHPLVNLERQFTGSGFQVGRGGDGERFVGDIAEIIVFNRALNDAERSRVITYLRKTYSLNQQVLHLPAAPVKFSPAFDNSEFWFADSVAVEMRTDTAGGEIHYTTDGSEPQKTSPVYKAPITLSATATLKAMAMMPQRGASVVQAATFHKWKAQPVTAKKLAGGWKYSWGDEFDGPEVNEKLWSYEIGHIRNSEAQYFTNRKENSRIDNGNLLIQGLADNWEGHQYTAASRTTDNNVKLTYGRYELRAKIDTRSGSWPAWWIFAKPSGAWPADGEIDMMEYYMGKVHTNIMDGKEGWFAGNKQTSIQKLGGTDWPKAFHTWTMDWDAHRIRIWLDGRMKVDYPVESANGTGPKGTNPFRAPETKKIVLNQALGGTRGGPLNPSDAPFDFRIDWLRVHTWSTGPAFTLTINNGSGSGPYAVGSEASIDAHMPPAGYVFDHWVGNVAVAKTIEASTRFKMPASDVTLTALYKPAAAMGGRQALAERASGFEDEEIKDNSKRTQFISTSKPPR